MNIIDIIVKKKNKEELSYEELKYAIDNYLSNNIEDYQMSSLLMAIVLNDMTDDETFNLTKVMLESGNAIDLSKISGVKVDKHSTGGVGDKTSLVVLPLSSSCGVRIAKMSGRSLGLTGGTIDKLESIKGFNTNLSLRKFINQVNNIGISIISQTNNLVPADKKIYALRDVSGTTESIPLIASSIMSKKLASGSDKIFLDVKVGKGAFMKDIKSARRLSKLMVDIGKKYNKETIALITNMDYPLGKTIGNSLEVIEALDTLNLKGDTNFLNLCLIEASYIVKMAKNISIDAAFKEVKKNYENKNGYKKLLEFISYQNGNINKMKVAKKTPVISSRNGYLTDIDTVALSKYCNSLGAGRISKNDKIDHAVGIKLNKTFNDKVSKGDILMYVYSNEGISNDLENMFTITSKKKDDLKIIYEIIK